MDEFIELIQTGTADAFLTLPFLIIGFAFFFGIITSNIGLLLLFFAHILIVPATSFFFNEKPFPFETSKTIKYILSLIVTSYFALADTGDSSTFSIIKYFSVPGLYILHYYSNLKNESKEKAPKPCSIIPGLQPDEIVYSNPSTWLSHITFFFSFVISNAFLVYNLPAPDLNLTDDSDQNKDRQASLDSRVRNRKWLTISIIIISSLIFLTLLYFRFMKTPCESGFFKSLPSLLITGFVGSSFVHWIYNFCGINPIDILGIVQGLVNPDMIDNPIVCVGS
jgi:hypothetical protein